MPMLEVTDEQVLELIKQLPSERKQTALFSLADEARTHLDRIQSKVESNMRRLAAERGLRWDQMTDEERVSFVDDLIHEDRSCS